MNNMPDEWYKIDFEEWISKTYQAWRSGGWESLESAIEKSDKTEVQNE